MRWLRAGFLPLSLLILVVAALVVPLPYVVERPGRNLSLAACVQVDHGQATPVEGDYLLTTITVLPSTAVEFVTALMDRDALVLPQQAVIPPGVGGGEYFRQQRQEFALTADRAAAVGLSAAGFPAEVTGDGVAVVQVQPGTPAEGVLEPGDVITAVNAQAVADESDLRSIIDALPPGEPAVVDLQRRGAEASVSLTPMEFEGRLILGLQPVTANPRVTLPVPVNVSAGTIGGPSAGLMIALTVYDQVVPGVDLAQGRVVAGTGSIDADGVVGPVSGAGLKVIAASEAGAELFLVPERNAAEARAGLPEGSDMEVVAVADFDQARTVLEESAGGPGATGTAAPVECPFEEAA